MPEVDVAANCTINQQADGDVLLAATHGTVWDADCIFPIPDNYQSEHAAPMMCAGATVWQCLHQYDVRPAQRVGIMGIGGLGHLAIKIAAAMGCHVVALSRSPDKRDDACDGTRHEQGQV
ncbi:uncharacterized protein G6M90_00g066420 [Metarhizium brunneum]|uniref:D-isomer specific 2-hydroxyacid dehydrogenase NAD-binding domain-containing protein n=1 Tax=Metarhizium brunneum TaxID=500148 RepID=A0A7D5UX01_9HYPO|nr:hypothetical protein G6M90_00g066420 [Metarhizium brunneum]